LDLQGKILKFLVENTINRLGSNKKVEVDCRVISSTNTDLTEQIKNKQFREDLFHRLNVVPIKIPNLSERIDDIPILSKHFVKELSSVNGLPPREFREEALTFLQGMNWPGNIRQLKNVIERVLILGEPSDKITSDELVFTPSKLQDSGEKVNLISSELAGMSLREAREIFERDYLMLQINRFGGNISKTSAFVEMERSALHRKLKSLGINSGHKN
jgi:two-component system nitrogen regulation response regulator NtrX